MQNHRYKIEDLKVGMWVYESELYDIYDTYIILLHCERVEPDEEEFIDLYGQVGFIGHEITSEASKVNIKENDPISVYHKCSIDMYEGLTYEY